MEPESLGPDIPIYTIGYGGRSVEQLTQLLHKYNIEFLIDIRSKPYSRFTPQFSRDALEKVLKLQRIRYVFMGDTLGGRPPDATCYDDEGRVVYSEVRTKAFYQSGIKRLQTIWDKQLSAALLCAEARPQECHRSKLIGNTLAELHIEVAHIDENGKPKTQSNINTLLLANQLPLFESVALHENINFSRKKYSLPDTRTP